MANLTIDDGVQVPIVLDACSFDSRQAMKLKDIEKRHEDQMKRRKKQWEKQMERMRKDFLQLLPADGELLSIDDPKIAKRRGSTDVLDAKLLRTLMMDYPHEGRRFRLRFNLAGFDPKSVIVTVDHERIVVQATQLADVDNEKTPENGKPPPLDLRPREKYARKIERPAEVDPKRVRAFLSSDGILTLEAQLPPQTLSLAGAVKSSPLHTPQQQHLPHDSPSNSAGHKSQNSSGSPKTPSTAPMKVGVPTFHDRDGVRVLSLTIDLGAQYKPSEVMVQVVKENRLLVKARHEERSSERMIKSKFCREYELSEKIETYSVRAGLAEDNHLIVGALAKVNPIGLVGAAGGAANKKQQQQQQSPAMKTKSPKSQATGSTNASSSDQQETSSISEHQHSSSKDITLPDTAPCPVINLASFPPTSSTTSL